MTDTLKDFDTTAKAAGLNFLLIGGHAVNAYGVERTTVDLDFLVLSNDLQKWKSALLSNGWLISYEFPHFIQFKPPDPHGFRVDLMLVDAETFAKLYKDSSEVSYGPCRLRIPSLLHLLALKLHALKNTDRQKIGKDYSDILALIHTHKLDIHSQELQTILKKYAPPIIHQRLLRDTSSDKSD
ncbi:MAG: nucleotidyl transferase AbiEii/AbiGii toxin family protein [Methylacidiphilales bacterium]|nr:nucleotidyl transferase AbiEii/AbiGii toxin family protein [Candidatus Methylacidiphilales bacterium]